jgi:hypothetical protein
MNRQRQGFWLPISESAVHGFWLLIFDSTAAQLAADF